MAVDPAVSKRFLEEVREHQRQCALEALKNTPPLTDDAARKKLNDDLDEIKQLLRQLVAAVTQ